MKKKIRLLLLDANVVIELFRLGLWDSVVDACEVILSRTVVEEARYYRGATADGAIDLEPYEEGGRIRVIELKASESAAFRNRFDPLFLERLDPGETESLAYLDGSPDHCLISSSDSIVFRVLGVLRRSAQGISLEEILGQIGLSKSLDWRFSKRFREQWTRHGQTDGTWGLGLKRDRKH